MVGQWKVKVTVPIPCSALWIGNNMILFQGPYMKSNLDEVLKKCLWIGPVETRTGHVGVVMLLVTAVQLD